MTVYGNQHLIFYPIFEQLTKKTIQGSFHPSLVKIHTIKNVLLDGRMDNENGW